MKQYGLLSAEPDLLGLGVTEDGGIAERLAMGAAGDAFMGDSWWKDKRESY
jgi:hypothetical protein